MEFTHAGAHRTSVQKPENQTLHKTVCYHSAERGTTGSLCSHFRFIISTNWRNRSSAVPCHLADASFWHKFTKWSHWKPKSALINDSMEIRLKWEPHSSLFSWIGRIGLGSKTLNCLGRYFETSYSRHVPKTGGIIALPSKMPSFVQILSRHRMYL